MKNYFYTHQARTNKIYVFWNGSWLNQLMEINNNYCWTSLNQCGINFEVGTHYKTAQKAIEDVMLYECTVYQLDTLDELAEFIKTGGEE